jgi:hypothetical protein
MPGQRRYIAAYHFGDELRNSGGKSSLVGELYDKRGCAACVNGHGQYDYKYSGFKQFAEQYYGCNNGGAEYEQ